MLMFLMVTVGCHKSSSTPAAKTYTVTFDSQSATVAASPASITVTTPAATVGTLPTAPTRAGYNFAGWYTGTAGSGTAFTASTIVTANITVYAKWASYTYTVIFDYQNGTGTTSSAIVASPATTSTLPTTPSRTGYTFNGWYTGAAGTGTAFKASTPVTASIRVYAYWTKM